MTDKQIVDGVDVSGCVYRAEEKCILKDDECCFFTNCDYKNWQRKEQECKMLKYGLGLANSYVNKYFQALQEIKGIAEICSFADSSELLLKRIKQILREISEVEND